MRSSSWLALALAATLASPSCVAPSPLDVSEEEIALPGDWDAPATTRAIAATQYVDVVEPPAVLPLGSCTSTDPWVGTCTHPACLRAHPGTTELDAYIRARWTYVRAGGTYTCRRNSNPDASDHLSVHSVGRAIDLMITPIAGQADNTAGDPIANWLIENAEYVGIQRVIWDGWYWNGERGFSQISDTRRADGSYRTDHHTNHIHVELSVDGAAERTRFFTEGAPPSTCPNVCYGTAVVQTDCSYVDCAVTGEVCLDGPPRCGAGAPPEPPEATLDASAAPPFVALLGGLTRYTSVAPTRLFDTRDGADSARLMRTDGTTSGPLTSTRRGIVSDWPGLPAGATSVWLNVAALPRGTAGFVSAVPLGATSTTSTVNFFPPRLRANAAAVGLGGGNAVSFVASTDVDVVADWTGAFTATGSGLRTYGPRRFLDTRATGAPLVAGTPFSLDVEAPAGATGVVASVAVVGATADGFLVAYPCASPIPSTSNINFAAGLVSTTTVISDLSDGSVCFFSNQPADLIVDVTGYLMPEGELSYQAMFATRLLDTRTPGTRYGGRLGVHQVIELPIQSIPGMPAEVLGVVANLVSISPGSRGYLSAFPCGAPIPGTSSLNFDSDDPAASLVVSSVGTGASGGPGSLCIFASARTDLVVDLMGVWVPTPAAPPPEPGPGPVSPDHPETMDPPMGPPPADDLLDAGPEVYEDSSVVFLPDGRVLGPEDFDDASTTTPRRDGATGPAGGAGGGCRCRVGRSGDAHGASLIAAMLGLAISIRRRRARR
jgi:hypothetical protein